MKGGQGVPNQGGREGGEEHVSSGMKGDATLTSADLITSVLRVTLKQSKTDPFRKGICLFLGKTATNLCPVAAMLNYLVVRGSQDGPLFIFKDGSFLTC